MATWATLGLDSYLRLLDGHMGRNRYRQLPETLGWPTWAAIGLDSYMRFLGRKFTLPRNLCHLVRVHLVAVRSQSNILSKMAASHGQNL